GEDIDKYVKVLSGGEKSRLALAKMLLEPYNLLVLDEPTNHLDLKSKDILKSALLQFSGSIIIVSHDRDFLSGLTHKVIEFKKAATKTILGDVNEFLEKRKLEKLSELNKSTLSSGRKDNKGVSQNKLDYQQRKEAEKAKRKIENKLKKLESEIEQLEDAITQMDAQLADPETHEKVVSNPDFFTNYENHKKQLHIIMEQWEEVAEMLEN
ncbi:MAG: glycosyl transferase family 2, partial [Bacteroidetes bacterium 4572_77]